MAEKEERYISITQMVAKENIETEKYRVMPRQEAIERIIKGVENSGEVGCFEEIQWVGGYKKLIAEAALNALLGEEK
jgi:hypothetical protein